MSIAADTAGKYAQGLARDDIGYTTLDSLTYIDKQTLVDAGVGVVKHRNAIMAAVPGICCSLSF